jgi:hypothetical protein
MRRWAACSAPMNRFLLTARVVHNVSSMIVRAVSFLAVSVLATACAREDARQSSVPSMYAPPPAAPVVRARETSTQTAGASPGTTWESMTTNTPPSASASSPPPDVVTVGLTTIGVDSAPAR